jgi:Cd(II)/Pb(II)-responsive transcriptional regulator
MTRTYQIGELARVADVPVETIRYYERGGLLPAPMRSAGNYRLYGENHKERLIFIRQCRALDMSLEEISELLKLKDVPQESCEQVNALLDAHIAHVAARMAELRKLKSDLQALRNQCGSVRPTSECAILAGLATGTATRAAKRNSPLSKTHR